ncbi:hypothetical protein AOQ84DRAFT_371025 [Glonium stellatum]|uniref:Uncharacterized protein n=1 Tax=Glonium stellatum TaxID=574774 RepID=A0A8E2JYX5_9PEZI|nr:hypothetical protein AOQ84DRAFT_371025 [Glonium stellatum]
MHTLREINTNSIVDILDPDFRSVDFSEDGPQLTVATHLRKDTQYGSLGYWMASNSCLSEEEREAYPKNLDIDTVHTPWRDEVYVFWNHVFYDVMNFLETVSCSVGHFHPPNHTAFSLPLSTPDEEHGGAESLALVKKWDTSVLLIPAHLAPGVKIRTTTIQLGSDGEMLECAQGTFSADSGGDLVPQERRKG